MKLIYHGMLLDHADVEALRFTPGGQVEIAVARAEMVAGFVMEQLYQYLHREADLFRRDLTDDELNHCAGVVFESCFNRQVDPETREDVTLDAYCDRVAARIEAIRANGEKTDVRRPC